MTRQALYVAMTRGRQSNHAYVATDSPAAEYDHTPGVTGRQILERVLATDGAEQSATATMRRRQDDAISTRRLLPIRDTLRAVPSTADNPAAQAERIAAEEIAALIRARLAELRPTARQPGSQHPQPPPRRSIEGIHR